jgi:hypothetical protein
MDDKGFEIIKGGNNSPVNPPAAERLLPIRGSSEGNIDRHPNHPSRRSAPINPSQGDLRVVPDSLLKRQHEPEEDSTPTK